MVRLSLSANLSSTRSCGKIPRENLKKSRLPTRSICNFMQKSADMSKDQANAAPAADSQLKAAELLERAKLLLESNVDEALQFCNRALEKA